MKELTKLALCPRLWCCMTEEGPEGNPLRIFCFKEPEDVSKTMASRITLEDLEGAYTRNEYKGRDSQFLLKLLEYRHPFALNFWYQLQVDDHSNRRHSPILLERTWETKFWPDRNFTWYLVVTEMNTTLADGYFRCGENLVPTFQFRRHILFHVPGVTYFHLEP